MAVPNTIFLFSKVKCKLFRFRRNIDTCLFRVIDILVIIMQIQTSRIERFEMQLSLDAQAIMDKVIPLAPAGYAIGLHIRFSTPTIMLQAYDPEWTQIYTANGYIMSDPTVHWGFTHQGTCRWSALGTPDPQDVLKKSAQYGLKYGFTAACELDGSRSIASFARTDREFTDDEIETINNLLVALHTETAKDLS